MIEAVAIMAASWAIIGVGLALTLTIAAVIGLPLTLGGLMVAATIVGARA
jgi:hypothetical protein